MALCGSCRACWLHVWAGIFFTEEDVFLDDKGVHFRGGVSRVHISQMAADEIGSWRGRRVRARDLLSRFELDSDVRGHRSVFFVEIRN